VEAIMDCATKDTKIMVLASICAVLRLDARIVLPDMVETRMRLVEMVEAAHVDNVLRELPVKVENAMEEVNRDEVSKEEVKTENPFMEETVI
jgi:hypothetical protein